MALKPIWYGGYELKKRWSISERDLIHYLIVGELIAYKSPGSGPYSKEYIKDLDQNNYWPFVSDHGPWGFSYHTDNVLEFEKKHNITVIQDENKNETKTSVTEIKLRPNQKAKNKCREVAKKLREQNPLITMAGAIRHKDMIEASKKKGGSCYLEDAIRGWIKNLWPEELRKPGRRKGT